MLKEFCPTDYIRVQFCVLILILMEHAQREVDTESMAEFNSGLNPYFNGTCSKSNGSTRASRHGIQS